MSSPMVGVAAANSLLFGVYGGLLQSQLDFPEQQPTLIQIFLAGSGSGLINSLISTPMELVKIRLQNQGIPTSESNTSTAPPRKHLGPIQMCRSIVKQQGIMGLYRGFYATLIRETPSYGAYFVSYEVLCRWLAPPGTDPKDLSGVRLMLAGGIGGIVGWTSTYPFDVVKTVIQSDTSYTRRPIIKCAQQIVADSGYRGLFKGISATVIRAFPTNVAILGTFHLSMVEMKRHGWVQGFPHISNT